MAATTKLWGGRFTGTQFVAQLHADIQGATDPLMTAFNESLPYDRALHTADITGSKAYARAIRKSGILNDHECSELLRGLDLVEQEWIDGKFVAQEHDEDIHTANERRLGEIIGKEIAGKLHTGRSRNDQVATDMRIWTREEGKKLVGILKELIGVMVSRAEKEIDVLMPGYTHLQVCHIIRG
jgi:argininosuccinate lyase